MLLHTELIRSFPGDSSKRVRIEVGVLEDGFRRKPSETFDLTLDINQYVSFIEEKIEMMDHIPTYKIIYPIGSPRIFENDKNPLVYNANYIEIEFL